jgi:hypothetical protein
MCGLKIKNPHLKIVNLTVRQVLVRVVLIWMILHHQVVVNLNVKQNKMGKVTLEFDSVEEATEIRDALDGYKWKLAVWDLDQKLRETTKYGASMIGNDGAADEEWAVAERVRDLIREFLSDYNLEME